jgi:hypothetical protein
MFGHLVYTYQYQPLLLVWKSQFHASSFPKVEKWTSIGKSSFSKPKSTVAHFPLLDRYYFCPIRKNTRFWLGNYISWITANICSCVINEYEENMHLRYPYWLVNVDIYWISIHIIIVPYICTYSKNKNMKSTYALNLTESHCTAFPISIPPFLLRCMRVNVNESASWKRKR